MTTDKYINSKAEQQHMSDQIGYVDGLTHGLEIATGFAEWCNMTWEYNAWDNKWESLLNRDTYTTSELLNKYLDTLKTK